MSDKRWDRQELLFGKQGQEAIASCQVAVVGVGGLGSHVAQQLSYLGVHSFVLIDGDFVDVTNLNRLIGAVGEDARRKRSKVDVVSQHIHRILGAAPVETLQE